MKEKIKNEEFDTIVEALKFLKKQKADIDIQIAECEQSILNKYEVDIKESLSLKDEPYGDITLDGIKFKVPKYIKWDEGRLAEIAGTLDNPRDYIDVKLSVSETSYKALPETLRTIFDSARKVSSGKINITFKESI